MSGLFALVFPVSFVYLLYLSIKRYRTGQRGPDRRMLWVAAASAISFFGVGTKGAGSFIFLLLLAGALYMAWKASGIQPVTMGTQSPATATPPQAVMEVTPGSGMDLMERVDVLQQADLTGTSADLTAVPSSMITPSAPRPAVAIQSPAVAAPEVKVTQVRDIPKFQVTDAYPPMVFGVLNPRQPTLLYDGEHDLMLIVWGKQRSGELAYEPISRRSITEAEILENGMTVTKTTGKTSTSMLSQGGRAVVGGLVAGAVGLAPVGAIIGGATGSKRKKETSVSQDIVSRVVLRLVTRNGNVPIVEYALLNRPAAPNSNEYMKARRTADTWHIRINQQLLKEDERQLGVQ